MRSREDYLDLKLSKVIDAIDKEIDVLKHVEQNRPGDFMEMAVRNEILQNIIDAMLSVGTYGDNVDCTNECDYASLRAGECECFNRKQDEIESRCPV